MASAPLHNILTSQFLQPAFQQALSHWNRQRLMPSVPSASWVDQLEKDNRMLRLEGAFMEELRADVRDEASKVPTDAEGFVAWFEALKDNGPGQGDPLFPWLSEQASRDDVRWFLQQEAAGEAGFDDLVALTQVKMPTRPRMELARNYWDEMGRGNVRGMHGPMLAQLVDILELEPEIETTAWESLALANAMTAMATARRYAWHSVGALGVIELTAPGRSRHTAAALRRIGLSQSQRRYFDLHAVLDIKHSEEWNAEVIGPAVKEDPSRAIPMAEGALIRLRCGERCFARYRAHFGLGGE